jgi:WD40 repeat protein
LKKKKKERKANFDSMKWFSVANDQTGIGEVKFMEWCSSMDLLAFLTADGSLRVHRFLSWQKVFSVSSEDFPSAINILAWSPDGKRLSVGCIDGTIFVINGENGEKLASNKIHESKIVSLSWVQEIEPVEKPISEVCGSPITTCELTESSFFFTFTFFFFICWKKDVSQRPLQSRFLEKR